MTGAVVAPAAEARRAMVELARGASIELSARDRASEDTLRVALPAGTAVHINHAPGDTHHGVIAAAGRVRRAGLVPVPHIAARYLASFTQLNDCLARAAGEAGVDQVFLVAGDVDRPVGPFDSGLAMLSTGLFQRHGIRRVGLPGYPEGHPKLGQAVLDDALRAKLAFARGSDLETFIVTQFSFEPAPIVDWIGRMRRLGVDAPVRVGLAGPASIATLARFAVRCGVGNSLRVLLGGHSSIARLLVEAGPEPVIRALAEDPATRARIAGLHIFTFGGFKRTSAWLRALAEP